MNRSRAQAARPALGNDPRQTPAERAKTARFVATPRNGQDNWYKIVNYGGDTTPATIYLYDEIGYWGTSAQTFVDELKEITAREIHVHINSPGGEVFDGMAIHACLRNHPARVTTIIDGLAASAASFIAQAGDHRVISRGATMMIHDASGLCWGNAGDMHQMADVLDKLSDNIADIYSNRGGGTVDGWRELMREETWYTAAEAVAAGLCDEMTDPDKGDDRPEEMVNRWDLTVFNYAGREAAPVPCNVRAQAAPVAVVEETAEQPQPEQAEVEAAPEPVVAEAPAEAVATATEPAETAAEPTAAATDVGVTATEAPAAEAEPAATAEVEPSADVDPAPEAVADEPTPTDSPPDNPAAADPTVVDAWTGLPDWAQDPTDEASTWADLVAQFTATTSSTVDEEFARLREAMK